MEGRVLTLKDENFLEIKNFLAVHENVMWVNWSGRYRLDAARAIGQARTG